MVNEWSVSHITHNFKGCTERAIHVVGTREGESELSNMNTVFT